MFFPDKFYRGRSEYSTFQKHVPAPYMRTNLTKTDYKEAYITISGLGFYDLYINGEKTTKGLLAPYISNPDDIVYFDRYDVTNLLNDGENAIGIILGNGMQNAPGGKVWDFDIARFRNAPCVALGITYIDNDGNETNIDIGETLKWHDSAILFDDLRAGCFYDANLEIDNWNMPTFDDSDWEFVNKADRPRGEYRICEAHPIRIYDEFKAVNIRPATLDKNFDQRSYMNMPTHFEIHKRGEEGILYDFGINAAGVCRLKINAKKGQLIYIQFCELMTTKGEPSFRNSGSFLPDGYGEVLYYVCKDGEQEFVPKFTYMGYRYALIFGLEPEQIKDDVLTYLRANSDFVERGNFSCSDEMMNTLGKMSRTSVLANFFYFPTDCPIREKNGWTGDAAVSCEHVLLTLDAEKSYREWLRNICKAQDDRGALPGIVPTGGWGFQWGNGPAWDNVLTELCYRIYRMRGDLTPAKECSENILRYLSYLESRRRSDGLIAIGLGDWLQPGKYADHADAPLFVTDSVISMYIAYKSMVLFDALGLKYQKTFAESIYNSLRQAIRDNIIDFNTMTVYSRSQTAQAICMYYGVFEKSELKQAGEVLVNLIHEKDDHFNCGMIGLRTIFHVLSDIGESELAYKMITRKDYPSYGMMVERGYTSLAEDFLPDKDIDRPNSLNHHFMGDIVNWFIQKIVGITVNPRGIGADNFNIAPNFIRQLDHASAFYDAPCGRIEVKWERKDNEVELIVKAPESATGYIIAPQNHRFVEKSDPKHYLNGAAVCTLKSGTYILTEIQTLL
jgi:alpha-L-rhamnosidase